MPLTVLSPCGIKRATVTPTDDGARIVYRVLSKPDLWRTVRVVTVPLPFHAALDVAYRVMARGG